MIYVNFIVIVTTVSVKKWRPYIRTAPRIIIFITSNLTKLKHTSRETSGTEQQRKICSRVLIYLVRICTSNKSLMKTDLPLNIQVSRLTALAAEAHQAEGQLRR
jgi:hypothetical protein